MSPLVAHPVGILQDSRRKVCLLTRTPPRKTSTVLLSFRVSNFLSIRDEQEFSFLSDSSSSRAPTHADDGWDEGIGTVAGIFGANASGKSNILKAIRFMRTAVTSSYTSWSSKEFIPLTSFALDPLCEEESALFEVVFQINKARYQYGFRITKKRVVGEWLYAYVTHRRQVWFERDISAEDEWYFGKSFTGRNRVISELTRPTTLFLSVAAANNHQMAMLVEHFLRAHLRSAWPNDRSERTRFTGAMSSNAQHWNEIVELMRFADLGIRDARVRRELVDDKEREQVLSIFRALAPEAGGGGLAEEQINEAIDSTSDTVEFGHSAGGGRGEVYLPLNAESLGTQVWFALVGPIIRAIRNGDTLMIDEIDASLHPHLTSEILRIFNDPEKNPKQAQLLFTSHDTTLLGGWLGCRELTRDQVWFTEKKVDGATVLYPLTDFSPRKTENLERGYLQGRYGAVPYLDKALITGITGEIISHEDHTNEPEPDDAIGVDEDSLP
jgi:uncharacterized protein